LPIEEITSIIHLEHINKRRATETITDIDEEGKKDGSEDGRKEGRKKERKKERNT
jgi:predicted transposase YdaD